MPWVKIDDMFPHHPKVAEIGPLGLALYVSGLCYSSRYLTDGFIPRSVVPMLLDFTGIVFETGGVKGVAGFYEDAEPMNIANGLVSVGLWYETERGFQVHDYLEYQPSGSEVKKQRAQNAERQKRHRERKKGDERNGVGNGVDNDLSNGVSNGVSNGPVTPTPNPNPNQLNVKELEDVKGVEGECEGERKSSDDDSPPPTQDDEVVNLTQDERYAVERVRQIRGMAKVTEQEIVKHIREIMDARGSSIPGGQFRKEILKFRDYYNTKRSNQPETKKWTHWKTALTNWIGKIDEQRAYANGQDRGSHDPASQIEPDHDFSWFKKHPSTR